MTFNEYLFSAFIEIQTDINENSEKNAFGNELLEKYFGIKLPCPYFTGCISINSDHALCTIGNITKIIPDEIYKSMCKRCFSEGMLIFNHVWAFFNFGEKNSIIFPFLDGEDKIYFFYHRTIKSLLNYENETMFPDVFIREYCVLTSIVKAIISRSFSISHLLNLSLMANTTMVISDVLSYWKLPNLELIHSLANTKYEGSEMEGRIQFVTSGTAPRISFNREQPIVIDEVRAIRKYFQMVGNRMSLVAKRHYYLDIDDKIVWLIEGIGTSDSLDAELRFSPGNKWKMTFLNEEIGYDGACYYARTIRRTDKIDKSVLSIIDDLFTVQESIKLTKIVEKLSNQKHGTMLVVSSIAREEAIRLGSLKRAIEIKDFDLSDLSANEVIALSSIDGCIISDINGTCTAFGAILDGDASISTDIARGARYNSALTYIQKMKEVGVKALAVIISEDGSIDAVSTANIESKKDMFDLMAGSLIDEYAVMQEVLYEKVRKPDATERLTRLYQSTKDAELKLVIYELIKAAYGDDNPLLNEEK